MNAFQSDVELAITTIDSSYIDQLSALLPETYDIEDRVDAGYGLVVRCATSDADIELDEKVLSFLRSLLPIASSLRSRDCMLRVAVFNTRATSTVVWTKDMLEMLGQFSAALEITTYPTA